MVPYDVESKDYDGDVIFLRDLRVSAVVGKDAWQRPSKPQPLIISVRLTYDTMIAGDTDNINQTTSYGLICKDVLNLIDRRGSFDDLMDLQCSIARIAGEWGGTKLQVSTKAPTVSLRAEGGIECQMTFERTGLDSRLLWSWTRMSWRVHNLRIACIIGVNPHERVKKQIVVINLHFAVKSSAHSDEGVDNLRCSHWADLVEGLVEATENSSYETLEAFAAAVANLALLQYPLSWINASIEKPSALTPVDGAGVEITRMAKNSSDRLS